MPASRNSQELNQNENNKTLTPDLTVPSTTLDETSSDDTWVHAEEDSSDEWIEVKDESPLPPAPTNLPPLFRSASTLFCPNKEKELEEGKKTFHLKHLAQKKDKTYHYKINSPDSPLTDLEVACQKWYEVVVGRKMVPKMRPYYDFNPHTHKYYVSGATSKNLEHFESIRKRPLTPEDLIIQGVERGANFKRTELAECLKKLDNCLERNARFETDPTKDSYYTRAWNTASWVYQSTKNSYQYLASKLITGEPNAVSIRTSLTAHLEPLSDLSNNGMHTLNILLDSRVKHINEKIKNTKDYQEELGLLHQAKTISAEIFMLDIQKPTDIKLFEELDQILIAENYDIEKETEAELKKLPLTGEKEQDEKLLLAKRNEIEAKKFLSRKLDRFGGQEFSLTLKDLRNYRTVKGLGVGITITTVNNDGDYHRDNGDYLGRRIDFDMSEEEFTYPFKEAEIKLVETWLHWVVGRKPNEKTHIKTPRDIRNLPKLFDAQPYFSPAKQTLLGTASLNQYFSSNNYTRDDVAVFSTLATHPVFIFHKFKTLLKYSMMPESIWQSTAALCVRNDLIYIDANGVKQNVLDSFVKYKVNSVAGLRKALFDTPEFKEFLKNDGEYVLDLIKKEFDDELNYFQSKIDNKQKTYYEAHVAAIKETRHFVTSFKEKKKLDAGCDWINHYIQMQPESPVAPENENKDEPRATMVKA